MTLLNRFSALAEKASFLVIFGIGVGAFWSVLKLPLQACMENVDEMGLATGILCSFRLFGGLIGLPMSSTILNSIFAQRIEALRQLHGELAVIQDVREAIGFVPLLTYVYPSTEGLNKS